jgi:hypothetical protein
MVKFIKHFLDFEDSSYESNSTTNSSCPSLPAKWCTYDSDGYRLCIQNPSLIPTCLLALYIGVSSSKRIARLSGKFPSRWYYQLAFLLYGIMMTSAGILHCFIGDPTNSSDTNDDSFRFTQLLVAIIDVGLTSNIAITILFCGLCDIRLFNPQSFVIRYLLFLLFFIVFMLWTFGLLDAWNWIVNVLYFGIVGICCLLYALTQLCIKTNRRALPTLFAAGIYGALGLFATSIGAEHICQSEGPFWSQYFGPQFIWFLFSDISMAFIFIYVIRANQEKKIQMKKYPIDIEQHFEKF